MTLVLLEGFEDLTSWSGNYGTSPGRNGNGARYNSGQGQSTQTFFIPSSLQTNSLTMGFAFRPVNMNNSPTLVEFRSDAAATTHLGLYGSSNGSINLWTGGTSRYTSALGFLTLNSWYYFELQSVLSDTGSVTLRCNGTTLYTNPSVDTKNAGTKTVFDSVFMLVGNASPCDWDDLYLTNSIDTFWGDIAVETLYPDGMDTTAWVGSDGDAVNNHLLVNEAGTPVDTTYVQASTVAAREIYTVQNLVRTTGSVLGVQVNARANKSDSGARGLKVVALESGGPQKSVYTTQTPDPSGQSVWGCIGADFTIAENGLLLGFRFYRDGGTSTTSRTIKAWSSGGAFLNGVVTTGETGTGWTTVMLATPTAITSGTTIRVGEDTGGSWYRYNASGAGSIVNGTLTRGTTWAGSAGNFPTTNAVPNDYYVDIIFKPGILRSTADTALTTSFADYPLPLEKKNDASAWTVADVNALGDRRGGVIVSLLWIEGFDGKTQDLTNAYSALYQRGVTYTTGRFGSGFAVIGNNGISTGYLEYYVGLGSAKTTLVTGVAIQNGSSYNGNEAGIFDFQSGGVTVLSLRVNPVGAASGTVGTVRVVRGAMNVAGTQLGVTNTVLPTNVWSYIEIKVVCGTGTSGSITVKQNGITTLTLTGIDTGSASLDGIGLRLGVAGVTAPNGSWNPWLDDWYVCDGTGSVNNDFLGDLRILNLVPVAAGSSTQLVASTGTNWSCVDEIPPVTTDYVGSAGVGFKDLYDVTQLGSGYQNIKGVRPAAYAFASDAGAIKGRNTVKSGSSFANGADDTLSATAQVFQDVIENDPATGAAWTNASLNAAEFGWEVRS